MQHEFQHEEEKPEAFLPTTQQTAQYDIFAERSALPQVTPEMEEAFARVRRRKKVRTVNEARAVAALRPPEAVPLLIGALRHRRADVRQAAGEVLLGFGEPAYTALLTSLLSKNLREREMAAWCLGEWGNPHAATHLLHALKSVLNTGKQSTWIVVLLVVTCAYLLVFVIPVLLANGSMRDTSRLQKNIVQALGKLGNVQAVAQLAELAGKGDRRPYALPAMARTALAQLLPHTWGMQAHEAHFLGAEAIPKLARLLSQQDDTLTLSILKTLQAVGDARAIPSVAYLQRQSNLSAVLRPEVEKTLAILHLRASQIDASMTLLRGSSAPAIAPDQLLRPAEPTPLQTPPDQLLRAATPAEYDLGEEKS
jgi:HEAT repeat protein